MLFFISFTYNRNNNGPKTDHWDTPQLVYCNEDIALPIETYSFLLLKESWNQFRLLASGDSWDNRKENKQN